MPGERSRKLSYAQARKNFIEYISELDLPAGEKLPSERELAEKLSISRRVISAVIDELVEEGRLIRKPRSGTYIAPDASTSAADTITLAVVMPWLSGRASGYESTASPQTPLFRVPFGSESMTLQIMHGIVAAANEHSARIVTYANNSPEEEKEILKRLAKEDISGIIMMPRRESADTIYGAAAGRPLVFIDHYFAGIDADRVVTANKQSTKEAVAHLISLGHKRIAFFSSFSDMTSIVDREAGYREALEEAGIEYDEDIVRGYEVMRNHTWGYDLALEHCYGAEDPATAVFCVDDFAVDRTLAAASKLGLNIPADICISGFFEYQIPDSIPIPFNRIVQDKFTVGQTAAKLAIGRILGEVTDAPQHIEIPAMLIPGN